MVYPVFSILKMANEELVFYGYRISVWEDDKGMVVTVPQQCGCT